MNRLDQGTPGLRAERAIATSLVEVTYNGLLGPKTQVFNTTWEAADWLGGCSWKGQQQKKYTQADLDAAVKLACEKYERILSLGADADAERGLMARVASIRQRWASAAPIDDSLSGTRTGRMSSSSPNFVEVSK